MIKVDNVKNKEMKGVTCMSCKLVSSVTEGLAIEKQVPSHGSRRILRVSTPA